MLYHFMFDAALKVFLCAFFSLSWRDLLVHANEGGARGMKGAGACARIMKTQNKRLVFCLLQVVVLHDLLMKLVFKLNS